MLHLGVEVTLLERRASAFQTRVLARDEAMFTKNSLALQGKKLNAGKDGSVRRQRRVRRGPYRQRPEGQGRGIGGRGTGQRADELEAAFAASLSVRVQDQEPRIGVRRVVGPGGTVHSSWKITRPSTPSATPRHACAAWLA